MATPNKKSSIYAQKLGRFGEQENAFLPKSSHKREEFLAAILSASKSAKSPSQDLNLQLPSGRVASASKVFSSSKSPPCDSQMRLLYPDRSNQKTKLLSTPIGTSPLRPAAAQSASSNPTIGTPANVDSIMSLSFSENNSESKRIPAVDLPEICPSETKDLSFRCMDEVDLDLGDTASIRTVLLNKSPSEESSQLSVSSRSNHRERGLRVSLTNRDLLNISLEGGMSSVDENSKEVNLTPRAGLGKKLAQEALARNTAVEARKLELAQKLLEKKKKLIEKQQTRVLRQEYFRHEEEKVQETTRQIMLERDALQARLDDLTFKKGEIKKKVVSMGKRFYEVKKQVVGVDGRMRGNALENLEKDLQIRESEARHILGEKKEVLSQLESKISSGAASVEQEVLASRRKQGLSKFLKTSLKEKQLVQELVQTLTQNYRELQRLVQLESQGIEEMLQSSTEDHQRIQRMADNDLNISINMPEIKRRVYRSDLDTTAAFVPDATILM